VPFLSAIILSVLLWCTDSDYPCDISKLFFQLKHSSGTHGSVVSLLAATLYQPNHVRNHKLWNIVSTARYILHMQVLPECCYICGRIVLQVSCRHCLFLCAFSFGHYIICSSLMYGFWLPMWHFKALLSIKTLIYCQLSHLHWQSSRIFKWPNVFLSQDPGQDPGPSNVACKSTKKGT
jgi:hypothetical protein